MSSKNKFLSALAIGTIAWFSSGQTMAQAVLGNSQSQSRMQFNSERRPGNPSETISISLDYNGLPPMLSIGTIHVVMEESSTIPPPNKVVSETLIAFIEKAPQNFILSFHPMLVLPGRTYVLRSEIYENGHLVWASTQPFEPLVSANSASIKMMMIQASATN